MTTTRIGLLLFPRSRSSISTGPFEVFTRLPGAQGAAAVEDRRSRRRPTPACGCWPICHPARLPAARRDLRARRARRQRAGGGGRRGARLVLRRPGRPGALCRPRSAPARWSWAPPGCCAASAPPRTGPRATCWRCSARHLPPGRVVRDGNLFTGGGVTAGIDFALTMAAELAGPQAAQAIQLQIEYAPAPPFDAGTPETAPPDVLSAASQRNAGTRAEREALVARITRGIRSRFVGWVACSETITACDYSAAGFRCSCSRGISSTRLQGRWRLSSCASRMSSQASLTAPVLPGSANRYVPPATPPSARDCIVEAPQPERSDAAIVGMRAAFDQPCHLKAVDQPHQRDRLHVEPCRKLSLAQSGLAIDSHQHGCFRPVERQPDLACTLHEPPPHQPRRVAHQEAERPTYRQGLGELQPRTRRRRFCRADWCVAPAWREPVRQPVEDKR